MMDTRALFLSAAALFLARSWHDRDRRWPYAAGLLTVEMGNFDALFIFTQLHQASATSIAFCHSLVAW